MAIDLDQTLDTIRARQWTLSDFDWEAPGADRVQGETWTNMKRFMADLVWIEHVGARGFKALAAKADDPTLAEIYRWFHAEEQRHANAELALMRRWGMVEEGEVPPCNVNTRLVIEFLDHHAEGLPFGLLSASIAMLEVALDGALIKFLLETIEDPLCHEVFHKINNDESRHLAVDFHVMEQMGLRSHGETLRTIGAMVKPTTLLAGLVALPLFTRIRGNLGRLGLDEGRFRGAALRFHEIGSRSEPTRKSLTFRIVRNNLTMLVDSQHPVYRVGGGLIALSGRIPPDWLGPYPSWVQDLTAEPYA